MDISSAELKAFDATARAGSMSAAARLLDVSQPTISAHIAGLERRFGVGLFHRRGRGVELTEFGRLLHEATARMGQAEAQAMQLLLSARQHYAGHLRLAAIGPFNVLPVIRRFRAACPNVKVSVAMADSRAVLRGILGHEHDVGFVLHRVDDPKVVCTAYRQQPLVVLAPAGHALASQATVSMQQLDGLEFVLREDGSGTRAVFEAGLAAAGVSVRCSLVVGSREGVKEAVAQGLGLGVVAASAHSPDPRVAVLPFTDGSLATHVHVACLKERMADSLVARFLHAAQAERLSFAAPDRSRRSEPPGA